MREALPALAQHGRLVLVTKGDLFHQESKLAASGLGDHFSGVEIVSEKTAETYARVFARYGAAPDEAVMVGNSLRSDILAGARSRRLGRAYSARVRMGARTRRGAGWGVAAGAATVVGWGERGA